MSLSDKVKELEQEVERLRLQPKVVVLDEGTLHTIQDWVDTEPGQGGYYDHSLKALAYGHELTFTRDQQALPSSTGTIRDWVWVARHDRTIVVRGKVVHREYTSLNARYEWR